MSERYLNITNDSCPMTFVKANLELEKLYDGESLEILLKGSEPLENVPRSAAESGYDVKSVVDNHNGTHKLVIGK